MTRNWSLVMIHLSIRIILHHRLVLSRLRHKAKFIVEDSLNNSFDSQFLSREHSRRVGNVHLEIVKTVNRICAILELIKSI